MRLDHINLWALRDGEGWAVIDTGMDTPPTVEAWDQLLKPGGALGGLPITRVIVTHMHPDHIGLAGWLTREFDCDLWMTFGEYMNCRVLVADGGREAPVEEVRFYVRAGWHQQAIEHHKARFGGYGKSISPLPQSYCRLRDGDHLVIGENEWQVVVGAGHSPEHACLYCPTLKLLISGDQVLPRITSNVSVFPTEPAADPLSQWLDSIAKLKRIIPDDVLVLPAHNLPFKGLHSRLNQLESGHRRDLQRVIGELTAGPKRVIDLFTTLFSRRIDEDALPLATGECLANLNYLIGKGRVDVNEDHCSVAWYMLKG